MTTSFSSASVWLPAELMIIVTLAFLSAEGTSPGRELPTTKGWYGRALLLNLAQLTITFVIATAWASLVGNEAVFTLAHWHSPVVEGLAAWGIGSFVFYWWHRLRHTEVLWRIFHQIHHSPSRLELATSFYKHPIEILADALLSTLLLFPLLGCSLEGALWFNFFAGVGEYFYHANLKTPSWLRYFIQTPELHSIHHQLDVHDHNFSDLPIWDRIFGTYKDTTEFAAQCGFPAGTEEKLGHMLVFQDVYPRRPDNT